MSSVIMGSELAAMQAANLATMASGLVMLPGGTFVMGSEEDGLNASPEHEVTVSPFQMGRFDVTNEGYGRFVDSLGRNRFALIGAYPKTGVKRLLALGNDGRIVRKSIKDVPTGELFPGSENITTIGGMTAFVNALKVVKVPDHKPLPGFDILPGFDRSRQPAVNVDWWSAFVYCALNGGSLPTEAQWEFAARVIQGNDALREHATASGHLEIGGVKKAHYDEGLITDVDDGRYEPLPSGLYQMVGNVWRWIGDWYGPYSADKTTDPSGPVTGSRKVLRGGSWFDGFFPLGLRAAYRANDLPGLRNYIIGLRFVALP